MEDIKAYIESGILELYVLGDVTPEEKLQVEAMEIGRASCRERVCT